eukprot:PLAT13490.1.p1 GENE.PLAT13490.1~~PLAT13490.1.p1  ORF type:complete len:288 (-),score=78.17 PLAT13490.1:295-1128(-)
MKTAVLLVALAAAFAAPAAAQYDQNTGIEMVYYSGAAYCDYNALANWTCAPCQQYLSNFNVVRVATDEGTNTQAFIGYDNEKALVSFRGTEPNSLKDWIDDLKFAKTKPYPNFPQASVHEGFFNAYMALRDQVLNALNEIMGQMGEMPVAVTGHSLGAAMAALCAADLTSNDYSIYYVYTFGQPRVGNLAFSQGYKAVLPNNWRVTHYEDVVPHLPPEDLGFHHTSTEIYYPEKVGMEHKTCDGSGEDPTCADSHDGLSVWDHVHYLDIPISGLCGS